MGLYTKIHYEKLLLNCKHCVQVSSLYATEQLHLSILLSNFYILREARICLLPENSSGIVLTENYMEFIL